jgi:hypothetical protein
MPSGGALRTRSAADGRIQQAEQEVPRVLRRAEATVSIIRVPQATRMISLGCVQETTMVTEEYSTPVGWRPSPDPPLCKEVA